MENSEEKEEQKPRTSPSPSTPPPLRKPKMADAGEKQQASVISSSCSNSSCATYNVSPHPSTTNASCANYNVLSTANANNSASSASNTANGGSISKSAANQKSSISNKTITKSAISKSSKSAKSSSQSHSGSAGTTGSGGGGGGTGSSKNSSPSGDSKADTEEDEDDQHPGGEAGSICECVQCEVCMEENWWRMAALQNSLLQQQGGSPPGLEFSENAATGLDLIGSAATMMLNQQRASTANGGGGGVPNEDMFRADFSMPKLLEFFECQNSMGIPNFPEDFDEFWLLVVKARLFNIFKYRGPEAYNRVVHKIRNIVRQFREELEVRERQEAAAAAMTAIISGKEPKMGTGIAAELVEGKKGAGVVGEEKTATNKMGTGNGKAKKQHPQKKASG